MDRREKIEHVKKRLDSIIEEIGAGTKDDDLSDMYLSNSFENDTITGQNYEDLAIAWICLKRAREQIE